MATGTLNGKAPAGNVTITTEARQTSRRGRPKKPAMVAEDFTPAVKAAPKTEKLEPEQITMPEITLPEADVNTATGVVFKKFGNWAVLAFNTDYTVVKDGEVSRTAGGFRKIAALPWHDYETGDDTIAVQLTVISKTDKKTAK